MLPLAVTLHPGHAQCADGLLQGLYQIFVLFLIMYGAPAHIPKFALPSACMAYSNIDASHLNVSSVNNAAVAGNQYNPVAPSPPGTDRTTSSAALAYPCPRSAC